MSEGKHIQVFVKAESGKKITLEVEPADTIEKLKAMILDKEGIPVECQFLLYNGKSLGKLLEDTCTLQECSIAHETTIQLLPRLVDRMQIFIRLLVGPMFVLTVEANESIESLMEKIAEVTGIPTAEQRLIFGGKQLADTHTLSDYNITNEAIVHVVLRLRARSMYIFVKMVTGKVYSLDVDPTYTIASLKSMLQEKEGVSTASHVLMFAGEMLEDSHTLNDYHVGNAATLDLVIPIRPRAMQVFVQLMTGSTTFTLDVEAVDTIESIKRVLEVKSGILSHQQLLFYNGKPLEDERPLADYGIQNEALIHLATRSVRGSEGSDD